MPGYSVTFSVVDNATKQIDAINKRIQAIRAPMERMSRSVSKFLDVSGLRRIADGFNWIARAAQSALKPLLAIVPVLGTITGAATIAGMVRLVSSFAQWGRQLDMNAHRIGISATQLNTWQQVMQLAGGNTEDMTGALTGLTDSIQQASISAGDARAWFNRWGISIYDANGKLKSASDLLPEVIKHLEDIPNPAQRAAVAQQVLGSAGEKLIFTLETTGRTLEQLQEHQKRLPQITQDDIKALEAFQGAQSDLGATFTALGGKIASVLARNFTPLMQHLDDFVLKHSPEIIAAVDRISNRFANWLDNVDWTKVQHGLDTVVTTLDTLSQNLDSIKLAAEIIAGIFIFKWGVGVAQAIYVVTRALGVLGSGAAGMASGAGGAGLLGALGTVAGLAAALAVLGHTYATNKSINEQIDANAAQMGFQKKGGGWLDPIPTYVNPTTGETLSYADMAKRQGAGPNGFMPGGPMPTVPPSTPPQPLGPARGMSEFYDRQRQLIYDEAVKQGIPNPAAFAELGATQATLESGGGKHTGADFNYYGIKAGAGVGGVGPAVSTQEEGAGGRYSIQSRFASFKSEEDAARGYVQYIRDHANLYKGVLQAKTADEAIAAQGSSGYATASNYGSSLRSIHDKYGGAAGPPVALNTTNAPTKGMVDIHVTHTNPPPGVQLGASAQGDVNLGPVRTEQYALTGP